MLEKVKLFLGITHNALDSELNEEIMAARAELIRLGVSTQKASQDNDPLITSAVKQYVASVRAKDETKSAGHMDSFKYQADCLRKSSGYKSEV